MKPAERQHLEILVRIGADSRDNAAMAINFGELNARTMGDLIWRGLADKATCKLRGMNYTRRAVGYWITEDGRKALAAEKKD